METLWSVRRPVRDLRPGDHAWLAYVSEEEQRHIAGSFVRGGLAAGDKVICLAGTGEMTAPDTVGPAAPGLLTVVPLERSSDAKSAMAALAQEISRAEALGFRGIRVTADMTWAVHHPGGLDRLLGCERHIERAVCPSTVVTAICQFDRRRCGPEELAALASTHSVQVAPDPEFEDSVLRIVRMFQPRGLSLSGELDASRHTILDQALATLLSAANHQEVHLDLSGLAFIDLGALNMLADVAARRAGLGPLVLDRMPPQLLTVVEAVGWNMLPGLRVGS